MCGGGEVTEVVRRVGLKLGKEWWVCGGGAGRSGEKNHGG